MKNNKFVAIAILTIFSVVAYGQQGKVHDWTDRPAIDGGKTTEKSLKPTEKSREAREPREHHGGERDRNDTKTNNSQSESQANAEKVYAEKARKVEQAKAKGIALVQKQTKNFLIKKGIMEILKYAFKHGWEALSKTIAGEIIGIVLDPTLAGGGQEEEFEKKNREADIKRAVEAETQKQIKEIDLNINQSIDVNRLIRIHDELPSETQVLIDYYWERQEFHQIEKIVNQSIEMSKDKTSTYKSNYIHKGLPPSKNLPPGMKRKAEN
jgi:hypothetical protein